MSDTSEVTLGQMLAGMEHFLRHGLPDWRLVMESDGTVAACEGYDHNGVHHVYYA